MMKFSFYLFFIINLVFLTFGIPVPETTVLTGSTQGYECFPSEGGHAEFAPHNELEAELLEFLSIKLGGRVSVERVVSGTGIPNVRKK